VTRPPLANEDIATSPRRAAARAHLRAMGLDERDWTRPMIGIATTWTGTMPCNLGQRELAQHVAALSLESDGDVRAKLAQAAEIAPVVGRFFDEVLVLAEDPALRANRLRLLLDLRDKIGALGDLSQIPV
jgi:hypothetical protein